MKNTNSNFTVICTRNFFFDPLKFTESTEIAEIASNKHEADRSLSEISRSKIDEEFLEENVDFPFILFNTIWNPVKNSVLNFNSKLFRLVKPF